MNKVLYEPPPFQILWMLEGYRLPGESLYDAADRWVTNEALALSGGCQVAAGDKIGVSKVTMWRRCVKYRLHDKPLRSPTAKLVRLA